MKIKNLATAVVCGVFVAGTVIAEDWDMPMAYSATNFHSEMGVVLLIRCVIIRVEILI